MKNENRSLDGGNPNGYPQGQGMPGYNQMNGNGFQGEYNYYYQVPVRKSSALAAALAIFLGTLGVHKFYMGKAVIGFTHLIITFVVIVLAEIDGGLIATIYGLLLLLEGIIYLTKSDQQFHQEYIYGNRNWF